MTFWHPLPRLLLGAGLAVSALGWGERPASALPLVGVGANIGAAIHYPLNGSGLAGDLTGDLDLMGARVGLQYWTQFGTGTNYVQGTLGYNVSPVPMLSIVPSIGGAMSQGLVGSAAGAGPLGQLSARFSPLLLPAALEATAGAAYLNGSMLLPYSAGVKLSLIPFTAFTLRYRGWAGSGSAVAGANGPELGIEIGL